MRTFETGKTVVEIIAWPEDKSWEGQSRTSEIIDQEVCRLELSSDVFHDVEEANRAYRGFADRMINEGLIPPSVEFRNMVSHASKKVFCILTASESVFNSSCEIGKMYIIESGKEDSRRICAVLLPEEEQETEANII